MILGLLACTQLTPGLGGAEQDTALPYLPSTPKLEGEEAAALAQSLLDVGLPTASPVAQAWTALVDTYGDEQCPERVGYSMLDAPFGCEASSGAYFSGMTALKQEADNVELLCDAYVLPASGGRFECGGEAIQQVGPNGKGRWTLLVGTFGWMEEPVLAGGAFSSALRIEAREDGTLILNGGLGHSGQAINFEALEWKGEVRSGALSVHGEHGWYRSVLGPAGCGAWVFEDGAAVGQGCLDIAPTIEAWLLGVGL